MKKIKQTSNLLKLNTCFKNIYVMEHWSSADDKFEPSKLKIIELLLKYAQSDWKIWSSQAQQPIMMAVPTV